ncbi:MAG: hypothetical protein RKR03_20285 [Candidatus Competibacter sp.]|nr:hypothetical protein [Candidatus Competibacter sp.]
MYGNYLRRIADRWQGELASIMAGYNFDLGDEFEIVVCRLLRAFLPSRYGVCRGHAIDRDGKKSQGDDVIVFDKLRYPTIGLRDECDFSRKEFVPVEAVYGYLEAKSTIILDDQKCPHASSQLLAHACKQAVDFREFCERRQSVSYNNGPPVPWIRSDRADPVFTAVISNGVKETATSELIANGPEVCEILNEKNRALTPIPDLVLLGSTAVGLPSRTPNVDQMDLISIANSIPHTGKIAPVAGMLCYFASEGDTIAWFAPEVHPLAFGCMALTAAINYIHLPPFPYDMVFTALGVQPST